MLKKKSQLEDDPGKKGDILNVITCSECSPVPRGDTAFFSHNHVFLVFSSEFSGHR